MATGQIKNSMETPVHILPNNSALPSGTTENGAGTWIEKTGCLVNISFNLKTTSNSAVTIPGFIPAGYRPHNDMSMVLSDGGGSGITIGNISTAGNVTLYFGSTKYAQGSVTYFSY